MENHSLFRSTKYWLIGILIWLTGDRGQIWLETLSILNRLKQGVAYEKELDLLEKFLNEGDTCIDVGANVGQWSYYMSKKVGSSGKVVAIEPMPVSNKVLNNVISKMKMKNVTAYKIALGDKEGRVSMHVDKNKYGAKFLSTSHISNDVTSLESRSQTPIKTLDGFVSSFNITNIRLIKCDIEGAELLFLKGGANVLKRDKPILICEIQELNTKQFGYAPKDIFTYLESLYYGAYKYRSGRLIPIDVPDPEEINYIFIHNGNNY